MSGQLSLPEPAPLPITPAQMAALWNQFEIDGGSVIRWDAALGEFRTRDFETFSLADVWATVKGLVGE